MAPVLKTGIPERVSGVRIPPSPPCSLDCREIRRHCSENRGRSPQFLQLLFSNWTGESVPPHSAGKLWSVFRWRADAQSGFQRPHQRTRPPTHSKSAWNGVLNRRAPCETGRMKVVAVIPARLASTRLPRKMLREIAGEPLIAWVYRAVERCPSLDQAIVATDSDEILRCCQQRGISVRMTSPAHRSGTERAHEISDVLAADVYLNIQGDEPLTLPEHIESLLALMQTPGIHVGTLRTPAAEVDINNPGAVKVVTDTSGK